MKHAQINVNAIYTYGRLGKHEWGRWDVIECTRINGEPVTRAVYKTWSREKAKRIAASYNMQVSEFYERKKAMTVSTLSEIGRKVYDAMQEYGEPSGDFK